MRRCIILAATTLEASFHWSPNYLLDEYEWNLYILRMQAFKVRCKLLRSLQTGGFAEQFDLTQLCTSK